MSARTPADYGIGSIMESSLSFNPQWGEATTHWSTFYLYAQFFWNSPVSYCPRAWGYPFSDYQRGPIRPGDAAGTTCVGKMTHRPFFLQRVGARYAEIEAASTALRHPRVQRWGRLSGSSALRRPSLNCILRSSASRQKYFSTQSGRRTENSKTATT